MIGYLLAIEFLINAVLILIIWHLHRRHRAAELWTSIPFETEHLSACDGYRLRKLFRSGARAITGSRFHKCCTSLITKEKKCRNG